MYDPKIHHMYHNSLTNYYLTYLTSTKHDVDVAHESTRIDDLYTNDNLILALSPCFIAGSVLAFIFLSFLVLH